MSPTAKRLIAVSVAFVALLVTVLVVAHRQEAKEEAPTFEEAAKLPTIDEDKVTEIEIRRPEGDAVVLKKADDGWRMSKPMEAQVNDNFVQLALGKLGSLHDDDTGIAATKASNHEKLEVAEKNGVEVVAKAGSEKLVDLFVGAYKGGNTMVRLAGDEKVHGVQGSIKATFNREPDDWRDKRIVDETASDVREIRFQSDEGTFHFVKGDDGTWKPADDQKEIEKFDPNKVGNIVSTLSRLRAVGFADSDVDRSEAGVGEGSSSVTMVLAKGGPQGEQDGGAESEPPTRETIVLRLGDALVGNERFYLVREGKEPIFEVSKLLADRLTPGEAQFQESKASPQPTQPGAPHPGQPMPGGKSKLTPEQMRQVMQALKKTPVKLGGGGGE